MKIRLTKYFSKNWSQWSNTFNKKAITNDGANLGYNFRLLFVTKIFMPQMLWILRRYYTRFQYSFSVAEVLVVVADFNFCFHIVFTLWYPPINRNNQHRCYVIKVFLKLLQISKENWSLFLIKLQACRDSNRGIFLWNLRNF